MSIENANNCIRPVTARLVARLLAPLIDSGTVTPTEFDAITICLKNLSHAKAPPTPLKLLTGQEAAEMLGISFSQFRALEKEGAFPFKRKMVGNKTVRYRNLDIIRYMMSDEIQTGMTDATDANSTPSAKKEVL